MFKTKCSYFVMNSMFSFDWISKTEQNGLLYFNSVIICHLPQEIEGSSKCKRAQGLNE